MTSDTTSEQAKKGSKCLPKGVTGPLKGGKYQARVTYKPADVKQRNLGLFATADDAAEAVAAAIRQLTGGIDPWQGQTVQQRHKRGEVRHRPLMPQCPGPPAQLTHARTHVLAGTIAGTQD